MKKIKKDSKRDLGLTAIILMFILWIILFIFCWKTTPDKIEGPVSNEQVVKIN